MAQIGTDVARCIELLKGGKLIGLPTETVYGLAGNALNESAILEIYRVKNRPKFDPLIAHTDDLEKAKEWVTDIPDQAMQLANAFWPGPLTILLSKKALIPDLLTSGLSRMAIRIPSHPLALKLLQGLDFPLAAPSANPFGFVSPTSAQHVQDQLGAELEYVLDGGPCQVGIESTIVGFEGEKVNIHRLGGVSIEQIESVVGPVNLHLNKSSNPVAPGQLKSHYSPGKPVIIGDISNSLKEFVGKKIGVISFRDDHPSNKTIVLSRQGDLNEAARNIFSALRDMKSANVDLILTERLPDEGLGRAINDRLSRAATQ